MGGKRKINAMLSDHDLQSIAQWMIKVKKTSSRSKIPNIRTLSLKYSVIGSGKTRIVYDLGNENVVKIALSKRGLSSNQIEYDLYNRCSSKLRRYLCPVIDYGEGWIVMKKMDRIDKLTDEYMLKLPVMKKKFLMEGIQARSLRSKNLAFSSRKNRLIVIDYGSFRYADVTR